MIIFFSISVSGQQSDFGNWYGISLSKKINKKWFAKADLQARTFQNGEFWRTTFIQPKIGYKPFKGYKVALAYRYNFREYINTQRFQIDNSYQKKWGKHRAQFRLRLQYTQTLGVKLASFRIRPRIRYTYKWNKKWRTFASVQSFYSTFRGPIIFDQMRYAFGVERRIKKGHNAQLTYMINHEYNRAYLENNYILSLKYKIDL